MIEVERKFHLNNRDEIEKALLNAGYRKGVAVHQVDKVFLLKSDSFKTFKTGDPVARIRTVDGTASLTYKRSINSDGDTLEHEMTVNPAESAVGLLLEMGYKPVTDVDKVRLEYKFEDVTVAIDEVKGLGSFVEIEIVCDEGKEGSAVKKVMSTATQLGLSSNDIETKKYDQLISEL